ncbi:hypothetical protein Tco_1165656 [Tanacetum coccineum]
MRTKQSCLVVSSGWSFVSAVPGQMTYPLKFPNNMTMQCPKSSSRTGVLVGIASICHCCSLCFQSQALRSTKRLWVRIHNDEDGDNDAYDDDGDDDVREISWYYETTRWHPKDPPDLFGIKKYRGSNSSDGDNIGDGFKIAGEVIGSGDEIESSEELKELLSDEAGK